MDTQAGTTTPDLIELLCTESHFYAFFQLVYLLESLNPNAVSVGHQGPVELETIRFRSADHLAFPASDVKSLEYAIKEKMFLLSSNFMGLYGTTSPLPAFYTEAIIAADLDESHRQDFLDLFHHRLFSLFYRIWKKYRYYIEYKKGANDIFSQRMFSLMGLGDPQLRTGGKINWERLLYYVGLLSMRSRSANILEKIISHYFFGLPVAIEQCVARWVPIDSTQQNRMGLGNSSLGEDFTIGDKVLDRAGKFNLKLGPLNFTEFCDFLPTGQHYDTIRELVKFLLIDQLDFDVVLILKKEEVPKMTLSEDAPCRLGWSGWMGNVKEDGVVVLRGRE
jgi:type VI secretion system protein ImpH